MVHIREFTISTNPHAYMGVAMLANSEYTGPEGLEVLRELYLADLVVEPHARGNLRILAAHHDWQ